MPFSGQLFGNGSWFVNAKHVSGATLQSVSFVSIRGRIQNVIQIIERHDASEIIERMGIEVVFGMAQFLNPHEIEVDVETVSKSR